jgi:16S rRNA processing protein RimM
MDEPTVVVGVVTGAHGLGGEVSVQNRSDNPHRWSAGSIVLREDGAALTIGSSRRHGRRLLVRFDGVTDRTAA